MASTPVIRVDTLLDGGEEGFLYIGSSNGATNYESKDEAIEALSYDHGWMGSATTRDITSEVRGVAHARGKYSYSPAEEPLFIEVTTKRVVAVYLGSARPQR